MRPVKDLLIEEYWNIAFREYTEEDSIVNSPKSKTKFNLMKPNKRYWYADPFLFEKDGKTYLFVEAFDNVTEVGVIACSEYVNGNFTNPEIVLKEDFHLSYPYVFEKDGKIYMMPETHEDNCIQFYEAVDFPKSWKKAEVKVQNVDAVDTVIENGLFIASVICPQKDMSIDLAVFDKEGKELPYSPVYKNSLEKRGAGLCFDHKGMRIRPSQGCLNNVYGGKVILNKITKCDAEGYVEEPFAEITPDNIEIPINAVPTGIHTYARSSKIEIVDVKLKRSNAQRLIWIAKKKLG